MNGPLLFPGKDIGIFDTNDTESFIAATKQYWGNSCPRMHNTPSSPSILSLVWLLLKIE